MSTSSTQFFVPDVKPGVLILLGLSPGVKGETKQTTFFRCALLHDGVFMHFQSFPLSRIGGYRPNDYVVGAMNAAQDAALFLKTKHIPAKGLKIQNGSEFRFPCDCGGLINPSISQCNPLDEAAHSGFYDVLRHTLRQHHHR